MGKIIKVINLDAGKIETRELSYTQEQEDSAKRKQAFKVNGIEFDGWCRECKRPVRKGDSTFIVNTDGLGQVIAECHHKWCCR